MKIKSLFLILILFFSASNAFSVVLCGKTSEGRTLKMICASGQQISSIAFASYGTPTGTCGNFKLSSCNAATSKSVVQSACVGKASCSVSASNSVFGDPCSGANKKLFVQVECGKAPTQTPTPTPTPSLTPTPTPLAAWIRCAVEDGICSFSGTRQVRYGLNGTYSYITATASIACSNSVFGDPLPYAEKVCEYSSSSSSTALTPTPAPTREPTSTTGTVGPTVTTFTTSGPITLSSGQTVTGLHITNPNGPCIQGFGVSNVRIYNNKIGPCGSGSDGVGILIRNNAHDITVDHNSFDDVASGLEVGSSTNNIVFDHNYASRIRGPMPRGQLVIFDHVNGSGHRITCNVSDQTTPGYKAGTEDHINPWSSSGTAASPILIKYNKLRGGGPSTSGGGMMLGDGGSSYITADSNILVNPGQYGIAIAGGHNNKQLNNKIYSSAFAWSNIGAYVWKWNAAEPDCYGHEVSGNRVNFTSSSGAASNWWDGANCGAITMNSNVFGDSTIGPAIWNETFPQCDY